MTYGLNVKADIKRKMSSLPDLCWTVTQCILNNSSRHTQHALGLHDFTLSILFLRMFFYVLLHFICNSLCPPLKPKLLYIFFIQSLFWSLNNHFASYCLVLSADLFAINVQIANTVTLVRSHALIKQHSSLLQHQITVIYTVTSANCTVVGGFNEYSVTPA